MAVAPAHELGENPLVAGLERLPVPPTTLAVFGATGDLSRRKLLPAIARPGGGAARAARPAPSRARDGSEQAWTVLGASRGEAGILGEGVRQALLGDPTYRPALAAAHELVT